MISEQMTEDERDIARSMLYELWQHQQQGHGSYYHKKWLVSCDYLGNPPDLAEQIALHEKVYQQLVKTGHIDVSPEDDTRCGLGDNANVSINVNI